MTEYASKISPHETEKSSTHRVVRVMERLHAEEVFGFPKLSKEFLDSLSFDDFTRWTDMLNGIVREIPISKRGMNGSGHIIEGNDHLGYGVRYQPPAAADRTLLMREAFERTKALKDPEIAGLELAFAVNAIHPYDDGNGRTGRMLYSLLARGYAGTDDDKAYYSAILENTKGRDIVNPDPSLVGIDKVLARRAHNKIVKERGINEPIPTYVLDGYNGAFANEETPDQLAVSSDISVDARNKLHDVLMDSPFVATTILTVVPFEQIAQYIKSYDGGKRVAIDGDSFVASLSEEQIQDLYRASQIGKREYVRSLIELSEDDFREIQATYHSR
jgi:hypothetical protein